MDTKPVWIAKMRMAGRSRSCLYRQVRVVHVWSGNPNPMRSKMKALCTFLLAVSLVNVGQAAGRAAKLEKGFARPPASARPWVYWF